MVTAAEVIERSAALGFTGTKPGFAQYLADLCNEPIKCPSIPVPIYLQGESCQMNFMPNGTLRG